MTGVRKENYVAYPVAGLGGSVSISATVAANLQKWAVTIKGGVVKTTPFGASGAWEVNTPTIKSWAATMDGFTDPTAAGAQLTLMNGISTVVTVIFAIDGVHNWSGNAIITGIDPAAASETMNTIKFSVTGTGPLTFA